MELCCSVSQDAESLGVRVAWTPSPRWLAGTSQAMREKGASVSEHLLCASQCAKPDTHIVLLKDHNDLARHGSIPTLQIGTLRLGVIMISGQDPTARWGQNRM